MGPRRRRDSWGRECEERISRGSRTAPWLGWVNGDGTGEVARGGGKAVRGTPRRMAVIPVALPRCPAMWSRVVEWMCRDSRRR